MRQLKFLFLCICLAFIAGPIFATEVGSQTFAFDFYAQVTEPENIIFSPLSINQAFSMIYQGSANNTAEQLSDVFYFKSDDLYGNETSEHIGRVIKSIDTHEDIELIMNNALWIDKRFDVYETYLEVVDDKYGAEIFTVDYVKDNEEITENVNSYVEEKTKGHIKEILESPLNKNSAFTLVNVLYFDAAWKNQFNKKETETRDFYPGTSEPISVEMMYQSNYYDYFENDLMQTVEIPYTHDQLSMILILPKEGENIESLESSLSFENYLDLMDATQEKKVNLYLPKFEYEFEIDLKQELQGMGVTDAFSERYADFSLMAEPTIPNSYISFAKHKAVIRVEEEGTEASAVSVGGGCFPAGTPVQTDSGSKYIEEIRIGDMVISYDLTNQVWTEDRVTDVIDLTTSGYLYTIKVGGMEFKATGNHPVFIVTENALDSRRRPRDIPDDEEYVYSSGRWVEAQDLRIGDVIFSEEGECHISKIHKRWTKDLPVYNLSLEKHHNYSITSLGILVHNKGSEEALEETVLADHPFIFLIRESSTNTILFMGKVMNPMFPESLWDRVLSFFK